MPLKNVPGRTETAGFSVGARLPDVDPMPPQRRCSTQAMFRAPEIHSLRKLDLLLIRGIRQYRVRSRGTISEDAVDDPVVLVPEYVLLRGCTLAETNDPA
jgi:hypothetical protein